MRNGEATAALDVGPGWVPVQEVLDARAQASDARAEAFESAQRAQGLEAGSREGLRQLRERVRADVSVHCSVVVVVVHVIGWLDTNDAPSLWVPPTNHPVFRHSVRTNW